MAVAPTGETELRARVCEVISQISGHQPDELEPDMYLELDLGLDSIKMITLMDAIMKLHPDHSPGQMPDAFASSRAIGMETIGDICRFLEEAWFGREAVVASPIDAERDPLRDGEPEAQDEGMEPGMRADHDLAIPNATYPFLISHQAVSTITICSVVEVEGPLDLDVLRQAWKTIIERHPALQAHFRKTEKAESFNDYRLVPAVRDVPEIRLHDWRSADKLSREERLREEIEARLDERFDLFRWPLHRIEVFRTENDAYSIMLTIAHVISDGLSNQQLIRELLEAYGQLLAGRQPELSPGTTAAAWNEAVRAINDWHDEEEQAFLLRHAEAQGKRNYAFLPDPPGAEDHPATGGGQAKAGIHRAWVDAQTTAKLRGAAGASGVSLFALVAAAYLMTVKEFDQSGQDIILNIPTGGRSYPHADVTGMIGAFAQNMSLTFKKEGLTGDAGMLRRIYDALSAPLMAGMDRAMARDAAISAKSRIRLVDGLIPEATCAFIRASLKSNLYLSQPGDLMTVLYTSGSTGTPKGVMLRHDGYMNRLAWHQKQFQTGPGERIAQKTSPCFDISIWEWFWPLMNGAAVCPLDRESVRNPWKLAEWIREMRIHVIHFVPSMFAEFVHAIEGEPGAFPDLRWIIFSGEALPKPIVRKWIDRFGTATKLANLYGPTEASIDVTCHVIDPGKDFATDGALPIGKPIDGAHVKILDGQMRETAPGQIGELWIGGVQLAAGYLKEETRTKEAFRPNPFADVPGDVLYRTGDYASFRADGSIDYHGRKDHQLKIRGYRVELGEIEATLMRHPAVREAAVIPHAVREGTKLIACLAGKEEPEAGLRTHLGKYLPSYMLPHRIVWFDRLPKTPNGKLDRNRLHGSPAARAGSGHPCRL